jgi:hypothetical protein
MACAGWGLETAFATEGNAYAASFGDVESFAERVATGGIAASDILTRIEQDGKIYVVAWGPRDSAVARCCSGATAASPLVYGTWPAWTALRRGQRCASSDGGAACVPSGMPGAERCRMVRRRMLLRRAEPRGGAGG